MRAAQPIASNRGRTLLALLASLLVLAAPCRAQSEPLLVRVIYDAPAACPTDTAFLQQVMQRARRARLAARAESAREFRATVTQRAGNFHARLEFVDSDRRAVSRELDGRTCEEVVTALVLVTALAIDPLMSEADRDPPPDAPSDASPAPRVSPAASVQPRPAPVAQSTNHRSTPLWGPTLAARLGLATDAGPNWAPSASIYLGLASPQKAAAVGLELAYAGSTSTSDGSANARFRLIGAGLEGCPWAAQLGRPLWVWTCAAIEAGFFEAEGLASSQLPYPSRVRAPWLASLLGVRAEVDLSRRLALQLGGRLRFPWVRDSYVYERPRVLAYATPAIGVVVQLGLLVRLGSHAP